MNSTLFCFIILVTASSLLFFSIIPAIFHHRSIISSSLFHTSTNSDHSHSCIVSYGQYDGKIYELHPTSSRSKEDTSDFSSAIVGKKRSPSSSSLRSFETVVVASAAITASSSSSSSSTAAFETINNTCLVESPWMRISRHSVRLPANTTDATALFDNTVGENNAATKEAAATRKIINDWLYIDYHDRINVLVEAPPSNDQEDDDDATKAIKEREFIILEQTKYALNGQTSLAIVGGVISIDEEPITAAKREVKEELSIVCTTWTSLGVSSGSSSTSGEHHETNNNNNNMNNRMKVGRFCTDVNRGMGWIYPYLATDCTYLDKENDGVSSSSQSSINNPNKKDDNDDDEVGGHDIEKQLVQRMTITNIRNAVIAGRFVEVQWSNTVALAMLHYFTMLSV